MNERFAVFACLQLSQRERGSRAPRAETTPRPERDGFFIAGDLGRVDVDSYMAIVAPRTLSFPAASTSIRRRPKPRSIDRWRAGERRDRRSAPRFRPQELDLSADISTQTLKSPPSRNTHRHCTRPQRSRQHQRQCRRPQRSRQQRRQPAWSMLLLSPLITLFDIGIMGMADALVRPSRTSALPTQSPAQPSTWRIFSLRYGLILNVGFHETAQLLSWPSIHGMWPFRASI